MGCVCEQGGGTFFFFGITRILAELPQDVEKFLNFQKHVIQIRKEDNYLNQRGNADEILVYFDMLSNYIIDEINKVSSKKHQAMRR
jgi:hypothetical protein